MYCQHWRANARSDATAVKQQGFSTGVQRQGPATVNVGYSWLAGIATILSCIPECMLLCIPPCMQADV
jgi:hypothetical protein